MRQPTSPEQAYAWYRAALEARRLHDAVPMHEIEPHCGWFKRKFHSDGVFVPARIWLVQHVSDGELTEPEILSCEIGGEPFDVDEAWIMLCANPIPQAEYDHMMRVRDWAKTWHRDEPEAQPMRPIDLFTVKPPTWGKQRKAKNV